MTVLPTTTKTVSRDIYLPNLSLPSLKMCFSSNTIDDPTKAPIPRSTNPFSRKIVDPTQQPIKITESNEAHQGDLQAQNTRSQERRKSSYKDRAAFVDVTDQEPKPVVKRPSMAEAGPEPPTAKKTANPNKNWRGRSTNPATFGLGFAADFGATPM